MIYGIFITPFIEKNSLNRVHPEKIGVCTNLNPVDQYYPFYRITKMILKDDYLAEKYKAIFIGLIEIQIFRMSPSCAQLTCLW